MKKCRLCGGPVTLVSEMRPLPPVDKFTQEPNALTLTQTDLYQCEKCGHVQLCDVIPPNDLYLDYLFRTGDDPVLVEHFRQYALDCQKNYPSKFVVEIGSNDGTLLQFFEARGSTVLGVDPNNVEKKVPTINAFFSLDVAEKIVAQNGRAELILANHVFAHMDDLNETVRGVKELLSPDGVFIFEAMYLHDLIGKRYYDTVFHEHLSYHAVGPLIGFFQRNGLELFHVEHNNCKGGSIRGFVCHRNKRTPILPAEPDITPESFTGFNADLEALREHVSTLGDAIGYGASASGIAMMHHVGLEDRIKFFVDDNPRRHGLYSPWGNKKVHSPDALYDSELPIVILAPRYTEAIMARHLLARRFVTLKPILHYESDGACWRGFQ